MKHTLLAAILASALATPAMAFVDMDNNVYVGATVSRIKANSDEPELKAKTAYSFYVGDEVRLNDQHSVIVEAGYSSSKHVKRETYKLDYQFKLPAGESVKIAPIVGVGYEELKFKDIGSGTPKVRRVFGEVGVKADINVATDIYVTPKVVYQHDFSTKLKGVDESGKLDKGNGVEVEVAVAKELVSGKVSVAPYYKMYRVKDGSNESSTLKEGGLKFQYDFN